MADEMNELSPGAMNRRTALKAGAAIGIGAVAMAGPQIGILGAAPAYAATCSSDLVCASDDRIGVNLGSNCGGFAELNQAVNVTENGITMTSNGVKPCFGGPTNATISVTSSFLECQVTVRYYIQGNGGGAGNPLCNQTVVGPVGPGTGTLVVPQIEDALLSTTCTGSLFADFSVCCTNEASCL